MYDILIRRGTIVDRPIVDGPIVHGIGAALRRGNVVIAGTWTAREMREV